MKWIHDYDLFLFDFDGLLVNTEHIHFQAYKNMCDQRGIKLTWNFQEFLSFAHIGSDVLKQAFVDQYPQLFEKEPDWQILYNEKKKAFYELLQSAKVELMPGVGFLLKALEKENIRRAVVTNSFKEQTDLIKKKVDVLKTIPHWVTRENYYLTKPDPECYLKAIELYGKKGDRVIGFEDSSRGVQALRQTPVIAVCICSAHYPLLNMILDQSVMYYETFDQIPQSGPTYYTQITESTKTDS